MYAVVSTNYYTFVHEDHEAGKAYEGKMILIDFDF